MNATQKSRYAEDSNIKHLHVEFKEDHWWDTAP
jgi:hypothetical protein